MARDGSELQAMAGTPLKIEAAGKSYLLVPMTVGMYAEWEAWAKRQPFVEAAARLKLFAEQGVEVEPDLKRQIWQDADAASRSADRVTEYMNGREGTILGFTMMMRARQPEVPDDELRAIVDALSLGQVMDMMDRASGVGDDSKNG